jgi:ribosome-associated protein
MKRRNPAAHEEPALPQQPQQGAAAITNLSPEETERQQRARYERAKQFAIDAARLASHTHCSNIVVLDVSDISPVTDFFVIATGTSPRQMRTVCDEVEEMGQPAGNVALSRSGYEGDHWILVDFVDVVVHLFHGDARLFYDLENLWGDARKVEWRDATTPAAAAPAE